LIPLGTTSGFAWDQSHAFRPSLIIDPITPITYHLYYSASNDNFGDAFYYAHGMIIIIILIKTKYI
jgi:hypothetical protein